MLNFSKNVPISIKASVRLDYEFARSDVLITTQSVESKTNHRKAIAKYKGTALPLDQLFDCIGEGEFTI